MNSAKTVSFATATGKRRTIRALQPISPIPDCDIVGLASDALRYVPSAFNSQSTRLSNHFSQAHCKLWSVTLAALETRLGAERYNSGIADRISAYAKGYGTILFWDDMEVPVVPQMNNGAAYHYHVVYPHHRVVPELSHSFLVLPTKAPQIGPPRLAPAEK
jgi:predicted oxidoreductase (fatty acid repression mutant protein)